MRTLAGAVLCKKHRWCGGLRGYEARLVGAPSCCSTIQSARNTGGVEACVGTRLAIVASSLVLGALQPKTFVALSLIKVQCSLVPRPSYGLGTRLGPVYRLARPVRISSHRLVHVVSGLWPGLLM